MDQSLQLHIHVNHFILDRPPEKIRTKENKRDFNQSVKMYESRFTTPNFDDFKINEVIGWLLILCSFLMISSFLTMTYFQEISSAIVLSFFCCYFRWISLKFFIHV